MQYIKRKIENEVKTLAREFPIVAILGPRQSGKSTLVQQLFKKYKYITLEDPDIRKQALNDPRGFLSEIGRRVIIDEAQKAPELFSYLQTASDKHNISGSYILTGSQNYLLSEKISQSLAGRIGIATLLPFSMEELKNQIKDDELNEILVRGFYPRIFDKKIRATSFYKTYMDTYLEKDIRLIKNITKYDIFHKFLQVVAGRNGQVINTLAISNECDISHNTVKEWLNLLERSYIIFTVRPYLKNFNRRITKKPKIFFYDTGLVCYLLNIHNTEHLKIHPFKGSIFETLIISEFVKNNFNLAQNREFYFWRDKQQREIDLIIQDGPQIKILEIKSGQTVRDDFFKHLNYFAKLSKETKEQFIIYTGPNETKANEIKIRNWRNIYKI